MRYEEWCLGHVNKRHQAQLCIDLCSPSIMKGTELVDSVHFHLAIMNDSSNEGSLFATNLYTLPKSIKKHGDNA